MYPTILPAPPTPIPSVLGPFVPIDISGRAALRKTTFDDFNFNKCLYTSAAPSSVIWTPGWYMGSNHVLGRGQTETSGSVAQEIPAVVASPSSVIGWRGFFTYSHFDPNDANGVFANYNFSVLSSILSSFRPKGKILDIQINFGRFNTSTPLRPSSTSDSGEIPTYMLSNSVYGNGLPTGTDAGVTPNAPTSTSGYNAQNTGGFGMRLDNIQVQDRCAKLATALAQFCDNDPNVGAIIICEDSNQVPYSGAGNQSSFLSAYQTLYQIFRSAFHHTPVCAQATFQVNQAGSQTVCNDMVAKGVVQGTADVYGASYHGNKFTASASGNVLTVSATLPPSGTSSAARSSINIGDIVEDISNNLSPNTTIIAFGTGSGGVGTYILNNSQSVASETMFSLNPNTPYGGMNWGLALYVGQNPGSIVGTPPDRRSQSACFLDRQVSSPDQLRSLDVVDLALMLNIGYRASKCYFGYTTGNTGSQAWTNWDSTLTAKFAANPLLNTAVPANL